VDGVAWCVERTGPLDLEALENDVLHASVPALVRTAGCCEGLSFGDALVEVELAAEEGLDALAPPWVTPVAVDCSMNSIQFKRRRRKQQQQQQEIEEGGDEKKGMKNIHVGGAVALTEEHDGDGGTAWRGRAAFGDVKRRDHDAGPPGAVGAAQQHQGALGRDIHRLPHSPPMYSLV
jgi:hypothetical protein